MSFGRLENLNGRVAVIAGGAGQVGMATAARLAMHGARIVALVRRDLEAVQAKLTALPFHRECEHFAVLASLGDSPSLDEAARVVKERARRCDILINAAGLTRSIKPADLNGLTDQIFDEILTANLRGVFSTIRAFAPLLKATGEGVIVNISSTASIGSRPANLSYACAKAGLDALTRCLGKALAPEIRVVGVRPGYLETRLSGVNYSPRSNEIKMAKAPLKRVGKADDVASAIEACILTLRFSTGTTLDIDGGQTL